MLNNEVFNIFSVIAVIIPILVIGVFIFTFSMMFSPKLRGKMLSKQIETLKHMTNYSKEDLETIGTSMGDIAINTTKNIVDNNKENLKNIGTKISDITIDTTENIFNKNKDKLDSIIEKGSDMSSIAVEKTVRAIKNGLKDTNIHCKYCGKSIDTDSKFCKNCGKKL